jgi:hypothetical protein
MMCTLSTLFLLLKVDYHCVVAIGKWVRNLMRGCVEERDTWELNQWSVGCSSSAPSQWLKLDELVVDKHSCRRTRDTCFDYRIEIRVCPVCFVL